MFDNADLIYRYTRAQAIADGVLVDVSGIAQEAGIRFQVALTRAVWERCVTIPPGVICQDDTGCLRASKRFLDTAKILLSLAGQQQVLDSPPEGYFPGQALFQLSQPPDMPLDVRQFHDVPPPEQTRRARHTLCQMEERLPGQQRYGRVRGDATGCSYIQQWGVNRARSVECWPAQRAFPYYGDNRH
jgi:hypothetical protein